jgi:hypothetical protein
MSPRTLSFTSRLESPADLVWARVSTFRGVNAELGPWLQMTAPPEALERSLDDAPTRAPLFSSWVLLLGVLPIDRHHFALDEVERGVGFKERSTSWSEREWIHVRRVEPAGDHACIVTDALTFTPRIPGTGPIVERVIGALFRHRHRALRARFGASSVA